MVFQNNRMLLWVWTNKGSAVLAWKSIWIGRMKVPYACAIATSSCKWSVHNLLELFAEIKSSEIQKLAFNGKAGKPQKYL